MTGRESRHLASFLSHVASQSWQHLFSLDGLFPIIIVTQDALPRQNGGSASRFPAVSLCGNMVGSDAVIVPWNTEGATLKRNRPLPDHGGSLLKCGRILSDAAGSCLIAERALSNATAISRLKMLYPRSATAPVRAKVAVDKPAGVW